MSTKGRNSNMSSESTTSDATWIPYVPHHPTKSPFACSSSDEDEKKRPAPSQPKKAPFIIISDDEEEEILDVRPLAIIYPSDDAEGSKNPNPSKEAKSQRVKMKCRSSVKKK